MTTRHRNRLAREARLSGALVEARKSTLSSALADLKEAGRVLSAANEEQLQTAIGAINAVLASLATAATTEADAACPTCGGTGKVGGGDCTDCEGTGVAPSESTRESRTKVFALAEAYSSSASDAASGAWIISSLLDLMAEEADEPDELPILQSAFASLMQWLAIEVAEIGGPEDDTTDPFAGFWGWESARKRLQDSGGPIKAGVPHVVAVLREAKPLKGDLVAVTEAALRDDGSGAVKIIAPGWGSSGYYSEAVLERDGPKVFPAGTKMFWDHPTFSEELERPERSLRDLAGELTSGATWNAAGSAGPGLYADVKVFEDFASTVNQLAPSIGVSIRAYGKATMGEAEGQSGQLITELVGAESVDFVTFPGAGGQVLQLFEAARPRLGNLKPEEAKMEVEKDPKFVEVAAERDRLRDGAVLREAKDVVATKLAEAEIPDATRAKLAAVLAAKPPTKDGALDQAAFEQTIEAAINAEREYLANLTEAGSIRGMGGSRTPDKDLTPELEAAFQDLGLSESAAKVAAAGRH